MPELEASAQTLGHPCLGWGCSSVIGWDQEAIAQTMESAFLDWVKRAVAQTMEPSAQSRGYSSYHCAPCLGWAQGNEC